MDDFDYLGTLDDEYLLSLFDEDADWWVVPSETTEEVQCNNVPNIDNTVEVNKDVMVVDNGNSEVQLDDTVKGVEVTDPYNHKTEVVTTTESTECRVPLPRAAKEGVSYVEEEDEDSLTNEFRKLRSYLGIPYYSKTSN